jgi:DNA-binding response OmpR family regulator
MSLVALVTFPLARHVVEPVKLIAPSMHKLTQGDYPQFIELKTQIDRHIKKLRKKLSDISDGKNWVKSVYGNGYRLVL